MISTNAMTEVTPAEVHVNTCRYEDLSMYEDGETAWSVSKVEVGTAEV